MDNSEPDEFMKNYWEAASSNDFAHVSPFIDRDASFFFSEGPFIGLEQIRKAFEQTWATITAERYTTGKLRWIVSDENTAVCTYDFTSDGYIGGVHRIMRGLGTNVLEKANGNWKIIHEHLSVIYRE